MNLNIIDAMKKLFLFILFFNLLYPNIFATIHTVSNNPKIPAQFEDIQTAIGIANDGDTIHVQPSGTTYSNIILNKNLVLIGGGFFNTEAFFLGFESQITQITILQNADQTVIADFLINNILIKSEDSEESHDNITLIHNAIGKIEFTITNSVLFFSGENISIRNNLINNISFVNWSDVQPKINIIIENNIIGWINDAGGENILIKNNLFNPKFGGPSLALSRLSDCVISSNIFLGHNNKSIGVNTTTGCIYDRNLSFLVIDEFSSPTENINVFTANISLVNQNDLLFNTNVDFNTNLRTIMNIDFTLVENSAAIASGSDGTDIGILGGNFPFRHNERFAYPYISSVQINNPVLGKDSKLIFTIKANYPNGN